MKQRILVRLLVDYDPETDAHPEEWAWDIEGADVVVLNSELVGWVPDQHQWVPGKRSA